MPETPRVAILMTVYNAAPWLREAVDSIRRQTFTDWALIAVDDGSTDESVAILSSYDDFRIELVQLPANIGRTPALRHAFDLARSPLYAVLDADDVWEPHMLASTVDFLDAHPDVVLVGGWATQIDGAGRRIGSFEPPTDDRALLDSFAWRNPFIHSAVLYRADAARAVGGYPIDVPYAQDFALWIRLARYGHVAMMGQALAQHRTIPSSMTMGKGTKPVVAADTLTLLRDANRHPGLSDEARRRGREEIAIASLRYAVALLRARRFREGLAAAIAALVRNPKVILWNRVYRTALLG